MLKVIGLSKAYNDKVALNDVSLTFPDKGLVIVKGESGSGKSTLLNLLTALDFPTSGKVEFDGLEITAQNGENFRRKYCGNVYQDYMLINGLTVRENIELGMQASGEEYEVDSVKELLTKVGIPESYADKKVSKLSGGEKQRVSIARAIAKKDAMIFADEPTGNLDSKNGARIMDLLKEISQDRLVIVVSHNEKLNVKYADYTVELFDGEVKSCNLPCEEEFQSCRQDKQVDFGRESKLRSRSLVRLAFWGVEKNKGKIVASMITFIMICILCVIFTVGVIGDQALAYTRSLNKSQSKDVMVFANNGFCNIDRRLARTFKKNLGVECAEVFEFDVKSSKEDVAEREKYFEKFGSTPKIKFAMAYNSDVGIAADVLYGDVPKKSEECMLPYCYAQYLANVCVDYRTDDLNDLLGKEIIAKDTTFKICGIFEEGIYYTDFEDVNSNTSEYEYFENVNNMAQCIILAPQMQDFLFQTVTMGIFGSSLKGFYFNMRDVKNVYGLFRKIDSVGASMGFWDYLPMTVHAESIYCTSDIYGILQNYRYIVFLPIMLISFICMAAIAYVSFGYLISSKAKSYNVLRSLGFSKKNFALLLFIQVFAIIIVEYAVGIALSALCSHLFGKAYVAFWTKGIATQLSTEVLLPIGYVAPLIVLGVMLLIGGVIVFAKTRSLFKKSIMENKTS
ncbi:MAG: ATP-binding cassette domain-containing protein [Clostridia bacterium]|nr:ATP-binding cassette domain-containing protein [Clostridia bacterium]